jgi:hypothetical protein
MTIKWDGGLPSPFQPPSTQPMLCLGLPLVLLALDQSIFDYDLESYVKKTGKDSPRIRYFAKAFVHHYILHHGVETLTWCDSYWSTVEMLRHRTMATIHHCISRWNRERPLLQSYCLIMVRVSMKNLWTPLHSASWIGDLDIRTAPTEARCGLKVQSDIHNTALLYMP